MQNINFIQSSKIIGSDNSVGIFDIFLDQIKVRDVFKPIQVIVPSLTMASWISDQITAKFGICSNINFILLSKFIENTYLENNNLTKLFNFQQTKFILFDYLVNYDVADSTFYEVNSYLIVNGRIDFYRAFQLANQLEDIFNEYIYLRSNEILDLSLFNYMPKWQKKLWDYFIKKVGFEKTYLDIYQFLVGNNKSLIVDKKIFIFGIGGIYKSQLDILRQISRFCHINWYYISVSNEYYGDLLSDVTKIRLQHKVLREPNLTISDLYLTSGNPLVANLANFSREFVELLLANEIYSYDIYSEPINPTDHNINLLQLIQNDILQLKYRIDCKYSINLVDEYLAQPIQLNDLGGIKFNICYNKMREVQVLFNELFNLISHHPELKLSDILVTSPNIDDYSSYIEAVFANEYAVNAKNELIKLPVIITGNKPQNNIGVIKALKFLLNTPFEIPISYFIEILGQSEVLKALTLSPDDISMVKTWLKHNQVRFGYDNTDYSRFEYKNFDINSFGRFIKNLVLGICLPDAILGNQAKLPIYNFNENEYVPYDNLENNQVGLVNKVIMIIEMISKVRRLLYSSALEYNLFNINQIKALIEEIKFSIFLDVEMQLELDKFIGMLNNVSLNNPINLLILNTLIDDYLSSFNTKVLFTNKITCASMQSVHHIPYKVIYILGMNWGEFPRLYSYNKLSVLSSYWSLADRNLNLEDKQLFLDTILSAQEFLFISYIGRSEKDNSEIKPSPLVNLLQNTIKDSVINEHVLTIISQLHPLHAFYNNETLNYSAFWSKVSHIVNQDMPNLRWDFSLDIPASKVVNPEQVILLNLKSLVNSFLYSNVNLYKTLKLDLYVDPIEVNDYEDIEVISRELLKRLYKIFMELDKNNHLDLLSNSGELANYLHTSGAISYAHIGDFQLSYSLNLYKAYIKIIGKQTANFSIECPEFNLSFSDEILFNGNTLIVTNELYNLRMVDMENYKINLELRVRALIYLLLSKFAQFKDKNNNIVKIDGVLVYALNLNLEQKFYRVNFSQHFDINDLWHRVLRFYLYSLTHPILIHRAALEEYLDAKDAERVVKMRKTYENTFENKGLTDLINDPIFADIALEYFKISPDKNILIRVAQILASIKFEEVQSNAF